MSLRFKLLTPLVLIALGAFAVLHLLVLPKVLDRAEQQVHRDLRRELGAFASALAPLAAARARAELSTAVDSLARHKPHWHALEVLDAAGARLYPYSAPPAPTDTGTLHLHEETLVADGRRVGTLRLRLPLDDQHAQVREAYVEVAALAVGALLLTMATLVAALERLVIRPLRALDSAAAALAGRERPASLPLARRDELGRLARSLESMHHELSKHDFELRQETKRHARTARQLARAKRAAENASELKSHFLAHISHEIRTPLTGMLGTSELLLGTALDARQRRLAETAHHSGKVVLDIVSDVLDLAKIESGKLNLVHDDFELEEVLGDVRKLLAPVAEGKGVRLTVAQPPALARRLRGDAGRLRQVLINLVGNALKFTESGSVDVGCAIEQQGDDLAALVLRFEVRDTGIGLALEHSERIFHSFVQVDESGTRKYGGTGLGLAICKQLVELMDGSIGVEGTPGGGATFWFTVRLESRAEDSASTPRAALAGPSEQMRETPRFPARVLVAEDNPVNAWVASGMLENLGCRVQTAADGLEAVEIFRSEPQDLVLMDCEMPGIDGFEATRRIRALERERDVRPVPIVAVTAHAIQGFRQRCLGAGLDDYLTKPFTQNDIEQLLHHWLARSPGDAPPLAARQPEPD